MAAKRPGTLPNRRRTVPIKVQQTSASSDANRRALKRMTPSELETGKTVEQLDAIQAEQRARVRARLGLAA